MAGAHPPPAAPAGQPDPACELRLADFARNLSVNAGARTGGSYLDLYHAPPLARPAPGA